MSLQSDLRKPGIAGWKAKMALYISHAQTNVEIINQLKPEAGKQARRSLEQLQREGKKILDSAEVLPDRADELVRLGKEIIALGDRMLPEIRRLADYSGCPSQLKWVKQGLKEAVSKLPELKNSMLTLGSEMLRYKVEKSKIIPQSNTCGFSKLNVTTSGADKISLTVDNKEIKHESSNILAKKQWEAKCAGERPGFDLLLRGPAGMPVTVEFQHEYEHLFKTQKKGNEGGKLEDRENFCALKETKTGAWQLTLPEKNNGEVKVYFSTAGFSARHVFGIVFGNEKELRFSCEIEYTAFRFIPIPYDGIHYIGYDSRNASWGLPELKTFIEKFAELHFKETKKKPYIGNKGLQDGVKYGHHKGNSHAGGYAVDIDFGVDTGNAKVGEKGYNSKAHKEQIKRYLACGSNYVLIGDEPLVNELGPCVEYDGTGDHNNHDHVNCPHK